MEDGPERNREHGRRFDSDLYHQNIVDANLYRGKHLTSPPKDRKHYLLSGRNRESPLYPPPRELLYRAVGSLQYLLRMSRKQLAVNVEMIYTKAVLTRIRHSY